MPYQPPTKNEILAELNALMKNANLAVSSLTKSRSTIALADSLAKELKDILQEMAPALKTEAWRKHRLISALKKIAAALNAEGNTAAANAIERTAQYAVAALEALPRVESGASGAQRRYASARAIAMSKKRGYVAMVSNAEENAGYETRMYATAWAEYAVAAAKTALAAWTEAMTNLNGEEEAYEEAKRDAEKSAEAEKKAKENAKRQEEELARANENAWELSNEGSYRRRRRRY